MPCWNARTEIKQPKRRETLIENRAQIELSKRLVQLDLNTPLDFTLDDLEVRDPEHDTLLGFLAEMEFRTLSKRIADALGAEAPVIEDAPAQTEDAAAPEWPAIDPEKYQRVSDMAALQKWIDRITYVGYVAVDTETTSLNEMQAELVGICLSVDPGEACYIPLIHKEGESSGDLFATDTLAEGQLGTDEVLKALKPVPPSDVTVEQTGVSTVLVIWTAPSPPPTNGYQVQITRGSTTTTDNVAGTSYTKSSLQHGVYSIRVKSLSRHFPGEATEPVEITVRGTFLS